MSSSPTSSAYRTCTDDSSSDVSCHRAPVTGYVTIGNVRVRLSSSGSTVSQPGGDSECCCGVPWPSRSRIPLPNLNSANNRRSIFSRGPSPVYRTTLEWTQQKTPNVVTSCFGRDKGNDRDVVVRRKPDIPAYFRLYNSANEGDTQRLLQDEGDSPQRDTLDRLPKFRFGGGERGRGGKRGNTPHKKKPRSSDKTERLRELTEKLKAPSSIRSDTGPSANNDKEQKPAKASGNSYKGISVSNAVSDSRDKPLTPMKQCSDSNVNVPDVSETKPQSHEDDIFECVNLRLPKPESRTIVGSYIQRTIPFRSASFSQVDFSPVDGKYIRCSRNVTPTARSGGPVTVSGSVTLPRKKLSDGSSTSVSPSSSTTLGGEEAISSNPSVDSAVGSGEWVFPKPILPSSPVHDPTESSQKLTNSRSLTHPLARRGLSSDNDIPFSSIDGNGLKSLSAVGVSDRQLEGVREESDTDSAAAPSELEGTYGVLVSPLRQEHDGGEPQLPDTLNKNEKTSVWLNDVKHKFGSDTVLKNENEEEKIETLKSGDFLQNSDSNEYEVYSESGDTGLVFNSNSTVDENDLVHSDSNITVVENVNKPDACDISEPVTETYVAKWPDVSVSQDDLKLGHSDFSNLKEIELPSPINSQANRVAPTSLGGNQDTNSEQNFSESYIECKTITPSVPETSDDIEKTEQIEDIEKTEQIEENTKRWSDEGTSGDRTSNEWPSSAQEEPQSPEEVNIKLNWSKPPEPPDREGRRWLERPRLVCQSSEEREDDVTSRSSPRRYNLLARADSLSDGESDTGDRRPNTPNRDRECTASPSLFAPSDQSDCESRFGGSSVVNRSPHSPRRYSKRPLRGPYGQMLEAEMKKPETSRKFSKLQYNDELKFLEEYGPSSPSQSVPSATPSSRISIGSSRPRAVDDCQLKRSFTSPDESVHCTSEPRTSPKRKVSANIPYSPENPTSAVTAESTPVVHHQRTTSSPSQLEGCSNAKVQRSSPQPSPQLLAQLLKGSSERIFAPESNLLLNNIVPSHHWKDTRTHVVVELYDTERSYVESLQTLVMKYLHPLKSPENAGLVDAALVDEIFYQVPAILAHHEEFLEELRKRLEHWDVKQCVGDVFLDTFTKQSVIETYTSFINNWKTAKEAIKATCHAKPAFARFLEAMAREHKGKLALDSLLIMPVQRIPRYELLIQTLLKHTEPCHPDHQSLMEAQREVHALAVRINCTERDSLELEQLEGLIEGLMHLVAPDRTFLRHDLVTAASGQGMGRKESAIFLFSDLLVITSIKRRSGTIRKPSTNCPGSVASSLEANKYKLLMKIPLDDVEVVKAKDENLKRMLREMENLMEDVATLSQMSELVSMLHCPHSQLEDNIREMLSALNKQLAERQNSDSQLSYLELMVNTQNGVDNMSLIFSKPDKRSSWEETFNEAKQRLALSTDKRPAPEFVAPVPIRKTRAGLQFTCAAPTLSLNSGVRDVWVCNSDGYVGQVCVLSLNPEPTVTSCNGVCNARILCIAAIPAGPTDQPTRCGRRTGSYNVNSSVSISVEDVDKSANIQLDSSSSSEDDDGEEPQENDVSSRYSGANTVTQLIGADSTEEMDNFQPTMWLGTEDGCIHVYNCSDNIRIKKNKVKIQHGSSVHSIIYLDNRVFVSLANGDISVYMRDPHGGWNTTEPYTVTVGTAATPVTKMVPINGKLWCSCHCLIKVLNTSTLLIEHSFAVSGETQRSVSCLAVSGLGVWVSLQNSAVVRLYHASSYECLGDVNIAPSVTKMLASCDDIIRQHKAACLRVTSLLACKDLLWIGTSAGVILTMPLPHVSASTTKISSSLTVTGVPHGHTGHVRFLTSVETKPPSELGELRYSSGRKDDSRMTSSKILVISGGDGYEDFRSASMSEIAGREDSTNHLLLWHV